MITDSTSIHLQSAALEDIVRALSEARAATSVAIAALRHQNGEIDSDVALTLERMVEDRLDLEITKLAVLLPADSELAMDAEDATLVSEEVGGRLRRTLSAKVETHLLATNDPN